MVSGHEDTVSGPETDHEHTSLDLPNSNKLARTKVHLGAVQDSLKPGLVLFRLYARSKPIVSTELCANAMLATAKWVGTTLNLATHKTNVKAAKF